MKEGMGVRFTEVLKLHVVGEVESGRISQSEASRRYGILGHSTVLKWCRKYGKLPSHREKGLKSMDEKDMELLRLRNENKALKQELEDARLRAVAFETLVNVAERELGIPIRKKYGAKRSGK